jgi:hypothetical protein
LTGISYSSEEGKFEEENLVSMFPIGNLETGMYNEKCRKSKKPTV